MTLKPYKVDLNLFWSLLVFNPVAGNSKFTKRACLSFTSNFKGNASLGGKIFHHPPSAGHRCQALI